MPEDVEKNTLDSPEIEKQPLKPELIVLIIIIFLSAFFRFVNLRANPKWYSDELVYINAAWNLIHGVFQTGPVKWTFFSPFLPNPPLYSIINGFLLLFNYDILATRMWVALCGVLTTVLLYFIGKELVNKNVGLLSAFLFSIYPLAIVHNRRGWPHNQAMLLIAIAFFSCLKYKNTLDKKWMYCCIISCGLATLTSYWVIGLLIFVFGFFFFVDKKELKTVVPFTLSFFSAFFILALLKFKGDLIFDIKSTWIMATAQAKHQNLVLFIINNYFNFIRIDYFIALGCIGLFFTAKKFEKISLISLFVLLSFEILRQRETIPVLFYPAVILTPLICLGLAILLNSIFSFIKKISGKKIPDIILAAMLIPFLPVVFSDFSQTLNGFNTPEDYLAAEDCRNTEETAIYINNNVSNFDFVLASSYVSWLLKCKSADLLVTALQAGKPNNIYPLTMDKKRFAFDCSYTNAKYFVTDILTRTWMVYENGVVDIMYTMELEGWKKVFEKGEYCVFANPKFLGEKEINPDIIIANSLIYSKIAELYFNNKIFGVAESMLQKALIVEPNDINAHFNIADVYLAEGKKNEAVKEYKIILQINPSSEEALTKLKSLINVFQNGK